MTKPLSLLSVFAVAATLQAQGPTANASARFLGQASWGATSASVAALQQSKSDPTTTFQSYITAQFALPPSSLDNTVPVPPSTVAPFYPAQQQFFYNAANGPDQLRQRVAFALSEIWVISGVKITDANQFLPYYRVLLGDASKNFYDVMYDITVNPGMGHYLDMVNNDRTPPTSPNSPNENYGREILQLFTVGTNQLNEDGTTKLDKDGNYIPMYSQDVVEGLAHVFTGWTYGPLVAGTKTTGHNPANFAVPMVPVEALHDTGTKLVLSETGTIDPATGLTVYQKMLPYQGSANADLVAALKAVFLNPNLPPFICKQLIQHLVSSNPSPAYVQRIVNVFKNNGNNVRGDMPSVVSAILLDQEARTGDNGDASTSSHLSEPVLYVSKLLRELSVPVTATNNLPGFANTMGQNLFFSPTVFNYFAPNYQIPSSPLLGPEFQIYSPSTAMVRANFVNSLVYGSMGLNLTPFITAATTNVGTLESFG